MTTERFLLDTHVWLWLMTGDPRLQAAQFAELQQEQRSGSLFVSAFSLWELAQKESAGKLEIESGLDLLVQESFDEGALQIVQVTPSILVAANRLPGAIHGDPADRILIATAREGNFTFLTHDGPILRYAAEGHVRVRAV